LGGQSLRGPRRILVLLRAPVVGRRQIVAVAPWEGEVIVEAKRDLHTFATTNLDFILRARAMPTIALGGFLTNCCVGSTKRTGHEKGYEIITGPRTSTGEHENAIRFDYPMFSAAMTSHAFTEQLLDGAAVTRAERAAPCRPHRRPHLRSALDEAVRRGDGRGQSLLSRVCRRAHQAFTR
jgi:hypothetical protein